MSYLIRSEYSEKLLLIFFYDIPADDWRFFRLLKFRINEIRQIVSDRYLRIIIAISSLSKTFLMLASICPGMMLLINLCNYVDKVWLVNSGSFWIRKQITLQHVFGLWILQWVFRQSNLESNTSFSQTWHPRFLKTTCHHSKTNSKTQSWLFIYFANDNHLVISLSILRSAINSCFLVRFLLPLNSESFKVVEFFVWGLLERIKLARISVGRFWLDWV